MFAYAVGKPVVGEKLSLALIALWKRLQAWLPGRALRCEFQAYLREQGYLAFGENAEHALACLKFAEEAGFREIWVDAFAHCAGMHARLDLSPEFGGLSRTTAARITRASLEMDLHINRVVKALGGFLEAELGSEHLGLSKPARDHLDHFRSFLHSHYVDSLGWFPPPHRNTWDKRPWQEMYEDFQALYEYLVDRESSRDWTSNRGATGGICMLQNVQAFDERHGYESLPHPLALLPHAPTSTGRRSIGSQTALRNFTLGKMPSVPEANLTPYQALTIATNSLDDHHIRRPLVQQYKGFECVRLEPKLDIIEARKVRWLLVYAVLQMLSSIMKGPKEVKDADATSYPVCVLTTGCPAFEDINDKLEDIVSNSLLSTPKRVLVPDAFDAREGRPPSRISIHPDCEADSAEDYFASNTVSRSDSSVSLNQLGLQSRPPPPLSRTDSFRNSMQVSVRSLVGSLNKRSSRRASLPLAPRRIPSYCEIVVEDYGNGTFVREKEAKDDSRPQTAFNADEPITPPADALPQFEFDFGFSVPNSELVLDDSQLEVQNMGLETPRPEASSPCESVIIDSNRSSYLNDDDSSDTDASSVDGDVSRHSAASDSDSLIAIFKLPAETMSKQQLCYRPSKQNLGLTAMCWSVNAGCYTPTGLIAPPVSRFAHHNRALSGDTITSNASSNYPETSNQAADIEETESRGRQRSRGIDQFAQNVPAVRTMTMAAY